MISDNIPETPNQSMQLPQLPQLPQLDFSFLDDDDDNNKDNATKPRTTSPLTQLPEFNELLGGMLNEQEVTVQVNNKTKDKKHSNNDNNDFFDSFNLFSDDENDEEINDDETIEECPLILTYQELNVIPGEDLAILDADVFKRSMDPSSNKITAQQILLIKDKRRVYKNRFSAKRSAAKQKQQLHKLKKQNKVLKKQISSLQKSYETISTSKTRYVEHVEKALEYRSCF